MLQILDIAPGDDSEVDAPYRLEYDREWLAILESTEPLMKYTDSPWLPPDDRCAPRLARI